MKRLFPTLFLLFLLFPLVSEAATERIRATITVTNNTETSDTFTVNSDIRTWTNATTSSTIATNAAGTVNGVATNLFQAIASHPFTGPRVTMEYANTNAILLIAPWDQPLSVLATGNWATVVLSTQSVTETYTAIWPWGGLNTTAIQSNQASAFVEGIGDYATNSFATNAVALANYLDIGPETHTIVSGKQIINGIFTNITVHAVAGTLTNIIGNDITITNLNSPGTGTGSISLGTGTAAGQSSISIGASSSADENGSIALGNLAIADTPGSIAIGVASSGGAYLGRGTAIGLGAKADGTNASSLGWTAYAYSNYSTALGAGTTATNNYATAIGYGSATTKASELMLGTSSNSVAIPGRLEPSGAGITNSLFTGNTTNNASWTTPVSTFAALSDGDNRITLADDDYYISLTGATTGTNSTIVGITNGWAGRALVIQNKLGYGIHLGHNDGAESFAKNRLQTYNAVAGYLEDDGTAFLRYDGNAQRWYVEQLTGDGGSGAGGISAYVSLIHSNVSESLVVPADPTTVTVTNYTRHLATNNVGLDLTTGEITIEKAGTYIVGFDVSFSGAGGGGGNTYIFEIYVNSAATGIRLRRKASSTDVGDVSMAATLDLAVGDVVTVEASESGGTSTITINESAFMVDSVSTAVTTTFYEGLAPATNLLTLYDEFFSGSGNSTVAGELGWATSPNLAGIAVNDHPGVMELDASGAANVESFMYIGTTVTAASGDISDKEWEMTWGIRILDISNHAIRIGFFDYVNIDTTDGIYFSVTNTASAGNWVAITEDNNTMTVTADATITCDLNWHEFKIKSNGAGTITFYIDSVLLATSTDNVTDDGMRIAITNFNTDGSGSGEVYVDWFQLTMELNR